MLLSLSSYLFELLNKGLRCLKDANNKGLFVSSCVKLLAGITFLGI